MTLPNDPNESNQEIAEQRAYERHQAALYGAANRIIANFDREDGIEVNEVWERADDAKPCHRRRNTGPIEVSHRRTL